MSSRAFVYASGTTIHQAKTAHDVLSRLVGSPELRAEPLEVWHYGETGQFDYTELSNSDPVERSLKAITAERYARIHDEAAAAIRSRGAAMRSEELMPYLLVALGAIGGGVASKIGEDIWSAVKQAILRLFRQDAAPPGPLTGALKALTAIHDSKSTGNPVVLVGVTELRLTFVVEPGLPAEAFSRAERLAVRPNLALQDVPLRWDRQKRCWQPVPECLVSEESFKVLWRDINGLAYVEHRRFERGGQK